MRSRGAGGTSDHLVPLCRMCHIEQHAKGIKTFFAGLGSASHLDTAAVYHKEWLDVEDWTDQSYDLAL